MATKRSILQSLLHETYGNDHLSDEMIKEFTQFFCTDAITKEDGSRDHVCVMFVPYNPETNEVFMSHHKKTDHWIPPAGHVKKGEAVRDAVIREWEEELGDEISFEDVQGPFYLSKSRMHEYKKYPECDHHYEMWYFVHTDGENVAVDGDEYHATEWVPVDKAIKRTEYKACVKAMEQLKKYI